MPENELKDGTVWYYLDPQPEGNPAVLLLHGLGANSESWQLQIPELMAGGYRVIAPDLPGFGNTAFRSGRWSIRDVAKNCAELLGSLGITRAVVTGISMGGTVALQLALDFPQMVDRLVLVNTFASLRPDTLSGWTYFLRRYAISTIKGVHVQAELVAQHIFPEPGQEELRRLLVAEVLNADQQVYRKAMRALGLFDVRGRLHEIKMPTLVISGERDTTVPLPNQQVLANCILNARQVFIPRAGHAVTVDQPEAFNRVLMEFLEERTQTTR